ncbi:MAG: K(+)-transporting ATPase subunit C [Herpetosiphonaceae bacterium]|nr:K(+)-transporting ATPase subunit C [Herpetosiphonaceae bacterium]
MAVYENKEAAPRSTFGRQLLTAVLATIVLTVLTGVLYPLLITGIAQVLFPGRANGSLIQRDGKVIGSELVGQNFSVDQFLLKNTVPPTQTQALQQYPYFFSRPSAAGAGYDGTASSFSNLGPTSQTLIDLVKGRVAAIKQVTGQGAANVPVDLVTASASGLDPEISPAAATYQVPRIARIRGLPVDQVQQLVNQNTRGRSLGFLGEPGVNVLKLNLALDAAKH